MILKKDLLKNLSEVIFYEYSGYCYFDANWADSFCDCISQNQKNTPGEDRRRRTVLLFWKLQWLRTFRKKIIDCRHEVVC